MLIDLDDVTLNVRDTGTGEPVVLLHGWPDSNELWRHQVAERWLSADGFRNLRESVRRWSCRPYRRRPWVCGAATTSRSPSAR